MQLKDKTAIITGGGRGIGRAVAIAFAAEGANVCVTARTAKEINEVAETITAGGRKGLAVPCDVSDRTAVESMVASAAEQLGRVDILFNNAGGGTERTAVADCDPDNWARVVEVNLLGAFYAARAVLPHLRAAGGGKIINVGSGMGHLARPGNSSYNVAKAGLWMLTRCLALELWEDNIAVNELVPGPVYTQLTADIFEPDAAHPAFNSEWVKEPGDVVPLAMFLATQPLRGPTGQSFSLARRPIG